MSTTITLGDSEKTMSATLADMSIAVDDPPIAALVSALDAVFGVMPLSSLVYATGTYTVTFKDARSYAVTVNAGTPSNAPGVATVPPSFELVSTSFWSHDEKALLELLATAINNLIFLHGMSAMTITYS